MSVTAKYIKIQRENEHLKKLLAFVCAQIELGDDANLDCDEGKQLWAWWESHKNKQSGAKK